MYHPDSADWRIIAQIQDGLPLAARPYLRIAAQTGLSEAEVIARIQNLRDQGIIKRFGIVVHHRRLGYQANGMVVWDIPDREVSETARRFTGFEFVTLCYRRPRHLSVWPYNLFTMIHGHDRATVDRNVAKMAELCGDFPREILFSRRCFKQRGARYVYREHQVMAAAGGA
jgi:DNA-binding Lrp family transcriptional regulator